VTVRQRDRPPHPRLAEGGRDEAEWRRRAEQDDVAALFSGDGREF